MHKRHWVGVLPAITTPFHSDLDVDHELLERHVRWLVDSGCAGIVALGSLGEAQTLTFDEKVEILRTCRRGMDDGAPLVAGIASLSTREAVALAVAAQRAGCDGLMVLPPYVYRGDERETLAHYSAVIEATSLSCMLYNNPVAYGTDVTPRQLERLADRHENLHAVKESSGDVRRVTAIHERLGPRLHVLAGMDDAVLESLAIGATGWVAGLVNALPHESVRLYDLAAAGQWDDARALYEWFLPLLRLDTVPKFVQLIKLVQTEAGWGRPTVRPPRLELEGDELAQTRSMIQQELARRPKPVKLVQTPPPAPVA